MKKPTLIISILSFLFVSCQHNPVRQYAYRQPENIKDGLEVGSLDEVNVDRALIERAVKSIDQGRYKEVHSMLIFKDGKLVFEEYFKGVVDGAGGLKITPRQMAKIGVTFLNKGFWKGKQIISEQWIEKSAASYLGNNWLNNWDDHWGMRGYAYSWWTHSFVKYAKKINMYYAAGWGGQYIMVIPELDAVIVFTGGNYTSYRHPFEILKKYILPAFS